MALRILIPVANGTEEMEAVTLIDLFRRAEADVLVAGTETVVTCARKTRLMADILLEDVDKDEQFHAVILPGGSAGTQALIEDEHLRKLLTYHKKDNQHIAAICAAPLLLHEHGLIDDDAAITSHPSVRDKLLDYKYQEKNVVSHGNMHTSRGAGTAMEFGLYLIEVFYGKEKRDQIATQILYS